MQTSSPIHFTLLLLLCAANVHAQEAPLPPSIPPVAPPLSVARPGHTGPGSSNIGSSANRTTAGQASVGVKSADALQPSLSPPTPVQTQYQQVIPQYPMLQPQTGLPTFSAPYQPAMGYQMHPYAVPVPVRPQIYYWRVGTRHCGQSFKDGICDCKLRVHSCTSDGAWRPSSEAELLARIVPDAPICVMVHGSLVDEWGSRLDSRGTYRWLRRAAPHMPLNVIFFDWPSQRCVGPHAALQFIQLGRQAARNGFPLAQFVSRLPVSSPICLMGHSHGARTVAAATQLLSGGEVQGRSLGHADRIHRLRLVLAAGAIDHDWLNPGKRYDRVVSRAESIISIENRLDFALALYPLQRPLGKKPLGSYGLKPSDEQALGANRNRIYHINVSRLLGKRHVWPYYYSQQRIADAIAPSVYFPDRYSSPRWMAPTAIQQAPVMPGQAPTIYPGPTIDHAPVIEQSVPSVGSLPQVWIR